MPPADLQLGVPADTPALTVDRTQSAKARAAIDAMIDRYVIDPLARSDLKAAVTLYRLHVMCDEGRAVLETWGRCDAMKARGGLVKASDPDALDYVGRVR